MKLTKRYFSLVVIISLVFFAIIRKNLAKTFLNIFKTTSSNIKSEYDNYKHSLEEYESFYNPLDDLQDITNNQNDMKYHMDDDKTNMDYIDNKYLFRRNCRMFNCFNSSRCNRNNFTVYVYPSDSDRKPSSKYEEILSIIKSSRYYVSEPDQACLLVLGVDTLDRDPLSEQYVNGIKYKLQSLPTWNGGENHIIFNLYSGTWPDYNMLDMGFDIGKAILAKASISKQHYRPSFDISLPLFHKQHQLKAGQEGYVMSSGLISGSARNILLSFKGKRYLSGIGSETRNSLHHMHNNRDIILLTTCKHGTNWRVMEDERCEEDNELYDRWDYGELMTNSTFCLVPRGRRLGSYRFLEALQSGCIVVLLSNDWVLPFSQVIQWDKTLLWADERLLLQLPTLVRNVGRERVVSMRQNSQFIWQHYLSSMQAIITTTLEIVRSRLEGTDDMRSWNSPLSRNHFLPSFSQSLSRYPLHSPLSSSFIVQSYDAFRSSSNVPNRDIGGFNWGNGDDEEVGGNGGFNNGGDLGVNNVNKSSGGIKDDERLNLLKESYQRYLVSEDDEEDDDEDVGDDDDYYRTVENDDDDNKNSFYRNRIGNLFGYKVFPDYNKNNHKTNNNNIKINQNNKINNNKVAPPLKLRMRTRPNEKFDAVILASKASFSSSPALSPPINSSLYKLIDTLRKIKSLNQIFVVWCLDSSNTSSSFHPSSPSIHHLVIPLQTHNKYLYDIDFDSYEDINDENNKNYNKNNNNRNKKNNNTRNKKNNHNKNNKKLKIVDAVLTLNEDSQLNKHQISFGWSVWRTNKDRIVSFNVASHYLQDNIYKYTSKPLEHFSLATTHQAFHHKYYSFLFTHNTPSHYLNNYICHDILMNALVAHVTNKAPISVGSSGSGGYNGEWVWKVFGESLIDDDEEEEEEEEDDEGYKNEYENDIRFEKNLPNMNVKNQKKKKVNSNKNENGKEKRDWLMKQHTCLLLVQQLYGYMPLKHSYVRFNPLLYKDPVSVKRKKYSRMR